MRSELNKRIVKNVLAWDGFLNTMIVKAATGEDMTKYAISCGNVQIEAEEFYRFREFIKSLINHEWSFTEISRIGKVSP